MKRAFAWWVLNFALVASTMFAILIMALLLFMICTEPMTVLLGLFLMAVAMVVIFGFVELSLRLDEPIGRLRNWAEKTIQEDRDAGSASDRKNV